jgi:hypothetical protein
MVLKDPEAARGVRLISGDIEVSQHTPGKAE